MLTETGRVVAVDDDGLWVETVRRSTCNACGVRQGCGHGLLERVREGQRGLIRVLPGEAAPGDCRIDDQVRISIPESLLLRASLLLYLLPLATLLAGAGLGAWLAPAADSDPAAMAGAALGLCLGLAVVRWHAWRHRDNPAMQPVLLAVLPRGEPASPDSATVLARSGP